MYLFSWLSHVTSLNPLTFKEIKPECAPSCLTLLLFFFLVEGEGGEGEQAEEVSSELVKEASPPSENPDQEVIVEALKSICNILLHNETGQVSLL